ncbi:hypothetical protein niasHS_008073 [Heterodera schachtii]|uniref:Uncharacterized protein n=1 Tax=Heterodera schachtii TaxID=97005 RepID=A0ABD2J7J1_HETSC
MVRISTRTPPYYHAYASPNGTVLARAHHRITTRTPNDVRVTQWYRTSTRTPPYYHATRTPPYYHAYAKRRMRHPMVPYQHAHTTVLQAYAIPIDASATQMYRCVRQCNAARCVPPSLTGPFPPSENLRRLPPNAAADPLILADPLPPRGRAPPTTALLRQTKTFDGPLPTQLRTPSRRAGGQLHRRTSSNAAADSLPPSGRAAPPANLLPPNKNLRRTPSQRSCGFPPAERAGSSTGEPPPSKQKPSTDPLPTQLRTPSRRAGGHFHPSP